MLRCDSVLGSIVVFCCDTDIAELSTELLLLIADEGVVSIEMVEPELVRFSALELDVLNIQLDTVLWPKLELDVLSIAPETVLRQALELDVLNIEPDADAPLIFDAVEPVARVEVTFPKCSAVFVLED